MSAAAPTASAFFALLRPRGSDQVRWSLWGLLIALVAALLVTLVWLAGRYEAATAPLDIRGRMAASKMKGN